MEEVLPSTEVDFTIADFFWLSGRAYVLHVDSLKVTPWLLHIKGSQEPSVAKKLFSDCTWGNLLLTRVGIGLYWPMIWLSTCP